MQYNEIYDICQPVMDWLKEHYPHGHKIVISTNGAEMIECGKLVTLDKDLKSFKFQKPFIPKDYEKEIQEILSIDTSNIQDDTRRAQIEALQIFLNHGKQSGIETKKERGYEMNLGYDIGDRVIQIDDRVAGEVIKFYRPTACKQKTMILCDDGRKYHAPSETFVKVGELEEEIVSKVKSRPPQLAMCAAMPLTQDDSQPLLVPHTYRNLKVAEDTTVTIDLKNLEKQLRERFCNQTGLNCGV